MTSEVTPEESAKKLKELSRKRQEILQMARMQRILRRAVSIRQQQEGIDTTTLAKRFGGGRLDDFLSKDGPITHGRLGYEAIVEYALSLPEADLNKADRRVLEGAKLLFASSTLNDQEYGLISFHDNTISLVFDIFICKETLAPHEKSHLFARAFGTDAEIVKRILSSRDTVAIAALAAPELAAGATSDCGSRIVELLTDTDTLQSKVYAAHEAEVTKLMELGAELDTLTRELRPHYVSYDAVSEAAGFRYEQVRYAVKGNIRKIAYETAEECLTKLREFAKRHQAEPESKNGRAKPLPAPPVTTAPSLQEEPRIIRPEPSKRIVQETGETPQPAVAPLPKAVLRDAGNYLPRLLTALEELHGNAAGLVQGGVPVSEEDQIRVCRLVGHLLTTFEVEDELLRRVLLITEHISSVSEFLRQSSGQSTTITSKRKSS